MRLLWISWILYQILHQSYFFLFPKLVKKVSYSFGVSVLICNFFIKTYHDYFIEIFLLVWARKNLIQVFRFLFYMTSAWWEFRRSRLTSSLFTRNMIQKVAHILGSRKNPNAACCLLFAACFMLPAACCLLL